MTNTKTEVVTVSYMEDFRPGDVIVEAAGDQTPPKVMRELPPRNPLPTTDGSIVVQTREDEAAEFGLVSAFLLNGLWYDTARPVRRLSPDVWASGWTLVYEAPAAAAETLKERK